MECTKRSWLGILYHQYSFNFDGCWITCLVYVDENLLMAGEKNYIDPLKWNPLIMNFCEYFGLSGNLHPSRLAPVFGPASLG